MAGLRRARRYEETNTPQLTGFLVFFVPLCRRAVVLREAQLVIMNAA
jgi:hypothetical protein